MKRWPLNTAYVWEYAPFVRIVLPFACGILCYDVFNLTHWSAFIALAIAAVSIGVFTAIAYKTHQSTNKLLAPLLTVCLLATGYGVAQHNDIRNNKYWFGANINPNNTYLAKLTAEPIEKEHTYKLTVDVVQTIADNGASRYATGNAFVYVYKDYTPMRLHKGDTVLLPGNWERITNAGNPFEFDYARYCRRNNIVYRQSCNPAAIRLYSTAAPNAMPVTDKVHTWCMAQLDRYLTDPQTKGLIQAMLLGDEVNLDEDLRQSYAETGIVHIIAISGGNVSIFFIAISWLLGWLRPARYQWMKYAIALPLVLFYVFMAGAPPSAVRAALMFGLLAIGSIFQQRHNSLNQLLAASFILLVYNPAWLFAIGFQLSFVAVLSLILFYSHLYDYIFPHKKETTKEPAINLYAPKWVKNKMKKVGEKLRSAIAASIAAEILTAPLVVYYFHTFPLFFLIANIAAFAFMGIVLLMGIAIIALSWLPLLAVFIAWGATMLTQCFHYIVYILQAINPRSLGFLLLTGVQWSLLVSVICGIAYFLVRKQKIALFTGLGSAVVFMGFLCVHKFTSLRQNKLIVFNTTKTSVIAHIAGNKHTLITNATDTAKIQYATKPSLIGWRAWQTGNTPITDICRIGTKKILILNSPPASAAKFPVSALIINYNGMVNPSFLKATFAPDVVVLNNLYDKVTTAQMKTAFANAHQKAHFVAIDGAWIAE